MGIKSHVGVLDVEVSFVEYGQYEEVGQINLWCIALFFWLQDPKLTFTKVYTAIKP